MAVLLRFTKKAVAAHRVARDNRQTYAQASEQHFLAAPKANVKFATGIPTNATWKGEEKMGASVQDCLGVDVKLSADAVRNACLNQIAEGNYTTKLVLEEGDKPIAMAMNGKGNEELGAKQLRLALLEMKMSENPASQVYACEAFAQLDAAAESNDANDEDAQMEAELTELAELEAVNA